MSPIIHWILNDWIHFFLISNSAVFFIYRFLIDTKFIIALIIKLIELQISYIYKAIQKNMKSIKSILLTYFIDHLKINLLVLVLQF
jgi:hypothetical protein